ncbi:uncharacterized protein LOC127442869 isoform X1 [Myxocyprinus asiaticus]|uniref:uncharacterized protein LOC127442869 isoform X1 n=1 Tax=Myxocyprinus asiaticus TaxID=70543 RepID=UPI00222299F4|nr:uncharacterized protein LOC127442869 isoform X1 [Myxocyprinus asiaticus]
MASSGSRTSEGSCASRPDAIEVGYANSYFRSQTPSPSTLSTTPSPSHARMAPGATTRQCSGCNKVIGNASKECHHCGMKVTQKKNLKAQKIKYNNQWAAKLKKGGNFCKIMNSVDLLLHKLEVLGVSPVLFITKQKGRQRSSGVLLKDRFMRSHPSLQVMRRLYDAIVRESSCKQNSTQSLPPDFPATLPPSLNSAPPDAGTSALTPSTPLLLPTSTQTTSTCISPTSAVLTPTSSVNTPTVFYMQTRRNRGKIQNDLTEVKEESQELDEMEERQSSSCSETENNFLQIKIEDTEEQRAETMYHIVRFLDSEEVEVVPAIWVKDDVCFWPPYKYNRIQRAIKSVEQPQETWTPYTIIVMYSANNYYEAQKKIPLLEQQSDVLSEVGNDSLKPPKWKIKRNADLITSADATPSQATSTACLSPEWWSKISVSSLRQNVHLSEQPQQQTAKQLWQEQNCAGPSQDQLNQVSWQQPVCDQEDPESSMHQRHGNILCCNPMLGSILHDLLKNQEIMKEQQRNLIKMVQDLQRNNTREIITANDLDQRRLPVEDLASLMALEDDIRSCPDTRSKMVLTLGFLGGVDVKDTVWRVMKQTMKNDLAKMVNWRGVNGKTSFQSLELKNVVIEAVRRNPQCTQATELDVEKVIRRWFHLASDREGGRKRREPLQHVNP